MRPTIIQVFLVTLLAGCLGGGQQALDAIPKPPPVPLNGTAMEYLDASGGFTDTPPEEESMVPLNWGCLQHPLGEAPPVWSSGQKETAYIVTAARIHYRAVAEVNTVACAARSEWTGWFGAANAVISHVSMDGPDVLEAGTPHDVTLEFQLPPGGLVVAPGERITLRLASYYNNELGAVHVALGPETRLELDWQTTDWEPGVAGAVTTHTGSIAGAACLGNLIEPHAPGIHTYTHEVDENTHGLDIELERIGSGPGPQDLDFLVYAPNGSIVAGGESPLGNEALHLRQPNLAVTGIGEYAIVVFVCNPQVANYTLIVRESWKEDLRPKYYT